MKVIRGKNPKSRSIKCFEGINEDIAALESEKLLGKIHEIIHENFLFKNI